MYIKNSNYIFLEWMTYLLYWKGKAYKPFLQLSFDPSKEIHRMCFHSSSRLE